MAASTALERALLAAPAAGAFDPEMVAGVPEPGRRYLLHALAPGTPLAAAVRLEVHFRMRLRADSEIFTDLPGVETLAPPRGFVWSARARIGLLPVRVRDRYADGRGEVNIRALGVLPVVCARGPDVDRSARGRLAIESVWLPSALLPGPGVVWEGLSAERARVALTVDGEAIPLTLTVGEDGGLREVVMRRHGDYGVDSWQALPYGVAVGSEATFGGYTVPTRLRGGWWYGSDRYDPAAAADLRVLDARYGER